MTGTLYSSRQVPLKHIGRGGVAARNWWCNTFGSLCGESIMLLGLLVLQEQPKHYRGMQKLRAVCLLCHQDDLHDSQGGNLPAVVML